MPTGSNKYLTDNTKVFSGWRRENCCYCRQGWVAKELYGNQSASRSRQPGSKPEQKSPRRIHRAVWEPGS